MMLRKKKGTYLVAYEYNDKDGEAGRGDCIITVNDPKLNADLIQKIKRDLKDPREYSFLSIRNIVELEG